jgi:hypothetical protein
MCWALVVCRRASLDVIEILAKIKHLMAEAADESPFTTLTSAAMASKHVMSRISDHCTASISSQEQNWSTPTGRLAWIALSWLIRKRGFWADSPERLSTRLKFEFVRVVEQFKITD